MGADTGREGDGGSPHDIVEAERDRILSVATDLFTKHGPATLSMKWVALEADVPSEQLTAEWPTMQAMLADVLDRLSSTFEAQAGDILSPDVDADDVIETFQHIIARALLDDADVSSLARDYSQVERWVKVFQDRFGLDERTARIRLSQTFALEWGWRLFGPHLRVSCGLEDEPDGLFIAEIRRLEAQILNLPPVDPRPDQT